MNLERSRRTMKRLSDQGQVSVEDVLNVLYDVCQDVKDGCGTPVEKLPCLDESELYRRLPWMARMVIRICRQNEDRISDAGRKAHLKELSDEAQKYSAELDRGAEELKEVLERRKAAADDLAGKQEELERIRTQAGMIQTEILQLETALEEERLKLEEEKAKKARELAVYEDGMRSLEKEREEIKSLLDGEEALKVQLLSDATRQEIQEMASRAERLADLRKRLASEFLPYGQEDAGEQNLARSLDQGLKQIRKQLTQYSKTLRDYADLLSDV